jgi:hypothetical protein
MMPKYNMLRSAGLVHIPGVAVGMIVGGCGPNKCSGLSGSGDVCFAFGILLHFLFNSPFDLQLCAWII